VSFIEHKAGAQGPIFDTEEKVKSLSLPVGRPAFNLVTKSSGGTRWHSWLTHCATSQKVAGSIPDGVIGIFHSRNPSGRTMALGSTQPLTEISTWNISWGVKAAGACG
jgi:hypothetical protein